MTMKDTPFDVIAGRIAGVRKGALTYRHEDLELIRGDKNRPVWNMANAITLLTDHGDWRGVLAFNEFTMRRMLLRPIPGQSGGIYPRPFEDDDYTAAQAWFNRNGFPRATREIVISATRKVCRNHAFDPLRDYLSDLEWDQTRRLPSLMTTYFGAETTPYTSEVGLR